jgi:signal transduction histidine kinase
MKLLDKSNRYFLAVSMLVFLTGGVLFYFLFQAIIDNHVINKLHERRNYVLKQLERSDSVILYQKYSANTLSIKPATRKLEHKELLSDTSIFDPIENRLLKFRQLTLVATSNGKTYEVQIRRGLIEQKGIIQAVIILEVLIFLAFVAILTVLNNLLSKQLWRPFYEILDTLNTYKLEGSETFVLGRNSVTEFNELASSIEKMTSKINREFATQKEFIENASHETQTPLAVIKNEMEVLMQTRGLSEKQMQSISTATLAANRLSKLNESLLILSRIENHQFHVVEDININDVVDRHLENLEELTAMKNIKVVRDFRDRIDTKMNPFLAEMLIENLISNAIKHNCSPGSIILITEGRELTIANNGDRPRQDPDKLFARFAKSNPQSTSLGLGLPIVKAICDTYMLSVDYTYNDKLHWLRIRFDNVG